MLWILLSFETERLELQFYRRSHLRNDASSVHHRRRDAYRWRPPAAESTNTTEFPRLRRNAYLKSQKVN